MYLFIVETTDRNLLHLSGQTDGLPKCWSFIVQHNGQWIRSALAINRDVLRPTLGPRIITEYDAVAETVRMLYPLDIPLDRIWSAESCTPELLSKPIWNKGEIQNERT